VKRRTRNAHATGPVSRPKVETVMGEFKRGDLKSSSGQTVTNPKQAQAIALSEGRRAKPK
jgi:hypothetical protein